GRPRAGGHQALHLRAVCAVGGIAGVLRALHGAPDSQMDVRGARLHWGADARIVR
nr:hypothetical protein [Tanacetum cinerariifolium]